LVEIELPNLVAIKMAPSRDIILSHSKCCVMQNSPKMTKTIYCLAVLCSSSILAARCDNGRRFDISDTFVNPNDQFSHYHARIIRDTTSSSPETGTRSKRATTASRDPTTGSSNGKVPSSFVVSTDSPYWGNNSKLDKDFWNSSWIFLTLKNCRKNWKIDFIFVPPENVYAVAE
jgi:hypothetical protein